jgi:hypothetical protein
MFPKRVPRLVYAQALSLLALVTATSLQAQVRIEPIEGTGGFASANPIRSDPAGRVFALFRRERVLRIAAPEAGIISEIRLDHPSLSPYPSLLGWKGDSLWITNSSQTGAVLFDGDGTPVRTIDFALPGPAGELSSRRVHAFLPEARVIVSTGASLAALAASDPVFESVLPALHPQIQPAHPVSELPILIANLKGSVLDTVAVRAVNKTGALIVPPEEERGSKRLLVSQVGQPYADSDLFSVSPDGSNIWIVQRRVPCGADPSFRLLRLASNGDTLVERVVPFVPQAIEPAWVTEKVTGLARGVPGPPERVAEAVRSAIHIPHYLPPVTRVLSDVQGWVWLQRETPPEAEYLTWDVFSPSGSMLHSFQIPSHFSVRAISGTIGWAVKQNEAGRLHRISKRDQK